MCMKSTGIVRKIDDLGRIVLPMELRKKMEIDRHDEIEIFVDGDAIVLKKHEESCIFCGSKDNLRQYKGKYVCYNCAATLGR